MDVFMQSAFGHGTPFFFLGKLKEIFGFANSSVELSRIVPLGSRE